MPPSNVLPSAEIPQQLGAARLSHQGEIVEPQLLEAAPEASVLLHLPRDEEPPRCRRIARKIEVTLLGIFRPGESTSSVQLPAFS